jgi:hypothetical protein
MGNMPSNNYINVNVKTNDEETELLLMKSVSDNYKKQLEEEEIKKEEEEEIKKKLEEEKIRKKLEEEEDFKRMFKIILDHVIGQLQIYRISTIEIKNGHVELKKQKIPSNQLDRILQNLPQSLPKDLPPYIITKTCSKNNDHIIYSISLINTNLIDEHFTSEIDKMKKELTQHFEEKLDYIIQHIKKVV